MNRVDARERILAAANRGRTSSAGPYTLRTIQQAVARVRNRRLVKPAVLTAAGYRPHGPNHRTAKAAS